MYSSSILKYALPNLTLFFHSSKLIKDAPSIVIFIVSPFAVKDISILYEGLPNSSLTIKFFSHLSLEPSKIFHIFFLVLLH